METTVQVQEKPDLEAQLRARANALTVIHVVDAETFRAADARVKELNEIKTSWEGYWAKIKKSAHETWKGIVAKEKDVLDIVDQKKENQRADAKVWTDEQERIRREEERKAQAIAQKQADDEALARAAELEREGDHETAAAVIAAPPPAPRVVVPTAVPAGYGNMTRKYYSAVVVDLLALAKAVVAGKVPVAAIAGNQTYLNSQATQLKETMNYPGVRVVVK